VEPLAETIARSRWHLRVFGSVFSIFGLMALGMAAVGIYAVMAHATGQRTREIGIRLALGAPSGQIMGDVMRRGLVQLGIGMAVGLAAAWFAGRLMTRLLFGVSPEDPSTYLSVAGVLLVAGLTACWAPARRAARLDPLVALRQD
jgi:ABC-type antimicrobial peptide transport system permease subunit